MKRYPPKRPTKQRATAALALLAGESQDSPQEARAKVYARACIKLDHDATTPPPASRTGHA